MTAQDMAGGIEMLRRAGLTPTPRRVVAAGLAFAGPLVAADACELCERAQEAGLDLPEEDAEHTLAELRAAGILPVMHLLPPVPRSTVEDARLCHAIGNPHRLAIVSVLAKGEACVGDIMAQVGLRPSALSQHLARLKADGVVECRRQSRRILYRIENRRVLTILRALSSS